eukprot:2374470-Prymnesium_polylepis.1
MVVVDALELDDGVLPRAVLSLKRVGKLELDGERGDGVVQLDVQLWVESKIVGLEVRVGVNRILDAVDDADLIVPLERAL